jgi:hypothetical protein
MRKFYKTVYTFTVLTEDNPVPDNMDLEDVLYECQDGGWSGDITSVSIDELSSAQMAKALLEQHSSPEFFDLEDDGTDLLCDS